MRYVKKYEGFMDIFKSKPKSKLKTSSGRPKGDVPSNFVVIISGDGLSGYKSRKISNILDNNPNSSYYTVDSDKCEVDYNIGKIKISDEDLISKFKTVSAWISNGKRIPIYFISYDGDLKKTQIMELGVNSIEGVQMDNKSDIRLITLKDIGDLPKGNDNLHFYLIKKAVVIRK